MRLAQHLEMKCKFVLFTTKKCRLTHLCFPIFSEVIIYCSICAKEFGCLHDYEMHLKSIHGGSVELEFEVVDDHLIEEIPAASETVEPEARPLQEKVFVRFFRGDNDNDKPQQHICTICAASFDKIDQLNDHISIHGLSFFLYDLN